LLVSRRLVAAFGSSLSTYDETMLMSGALWEG